MNQPPPPPFEPAEAVTIAQAREIRWRPMSDLVGTVLAKRSIMVSNELAGVIKELPFESGTIVEPGQVLLVQDSASDLADLDAAKAALRVAQANVAVAQPRVTVAGSEFARLANAKERGAASEMDYDRAKAEVDRAKADLERTHAEVTQAEARVAQVQARLDKRTIVAPFRARVGLKTVHLGQYLAEGAQIVMLQEISDTIHLDFAIPQEYLARVVPGLEVMATCPVMGPDPIKITVVAIDATVNNETRNVRVRASVDNPDDRLRPGMFVQIRVPVEPEQTYTAVPITAVRRSSYGDQVFIVSDGKEPGTMRASQRFVKLGPMVENDVIVLEGVKPGERIAANGSFKLREGSLVMSTAPGGSPGAPPGATPAAAPEASPGTH
jgi:membrane fusion protein (multidrug efflux system)